MSELALRHDAGVETETPLPQEAYADIAPDADVPFQPELAPLDARSSACTTSRWRRRPGARTGRAASSATLLGLEELPKPESLAGRGGVWFRVGAQELHVGVEGDFSPARKAHPAFAVADVDALRAGSRRRASRPRTRPAIPGLARFYVADPWGNRVELTAPPQR